MKNVQATSIIFDKMSRFSKFIAACLCILLILVVKENRAQVLGNLESGRTKQVIATSTSGDNIYTVSLIDNTQLAEKFEICIYNGLYWSCLPTFSFPQAVLSTGNPFYRITSICELNNEIYIGGRFENGSVINETNNLFKFNKVTDQWESVANNIKTRNDGINQMVVYNNSLIAAGSFSKAGGADVSNIAEFDGTNWDFLGSSNSSEGSNGPINALEIINDNLYVAGNFTEVGDQFTGSIARWKTGEGWGGIGSPFSNGETKYLKSYGTGLVAVGITHTGDSMVRIFKGGLWFLPSLTTPTLVNTTDIPEPLVIDNKLFLYGPFKNGTDLFDLAHLSQSNWLKSDVDIPNDVSFVAYKNEALAFGDFNFNQNGRSYNNILKLSNSTLILKGNVFGDLNNSCTKDGLEEGVQSQVRITSQDFSKEFYLIETDAQGNWEAELNLQKPYLIEAFFSKDRYKQNCTSVQLNAQSSAKVIQDLNLGLNFSTAEYDLSLSSANLMGITSPTNKESNIYFFITNTGNRTLSNKSVHATLPDNISIKSISPLPADITGQNYTWAVNNLKPGETLRVLICLDKMSTPVGTKLQFISRGGSGILADDTDKTDNDDTLKTIVGNINTNTFKTVSKEGKFTSLNELDYGIYFQNPTGRTIKTITVIDTLDTDLPVKKIRLTDISHYANRELKGNIYKVVYENVNLQSAENGASVSSAFFNYKFFLNDLKQKFVDQTFTNTATIVYEYYEKESTNTVETVLVKYNNNPNIQNKMGIKAYPNPSVKQMIIENLNSSQISAQVYDINGKLIKNIILPKYGSYVLNTEQFASGFYFLKTEKGSFKFAVK